MTALVKLRKKLSIPDQSCQKNMIVGLNRAKTTNDYAREDQQQFSRPDQTRAIGGNK
jgi:hypothetical protein